MERFASLTLASQDPMPVIVWVGVLIGLVMAGTLAVVAFRRTLFAKDVGTQDEGVLESMRKLRDTGRMTDEEFNAARKALVRKASARINTGKGESKQAGTPATENAQSPTNGPGSFPFRHNVNNDSEKN